jgi:hypothetical protein
LSSRAFDGRAHHAGGAFRAQRQRAPAAVGERVGFLVDDVRRLADAAVEQLGVLEDRRADLVEVVEQRGLARDLLDRLPLGRIGGENVLCALGGLNRGSHCGAGFYAPQERNATTARLLRRGRLADSE